MQSIKDHAKELTEKYKFVCVPLANGAKYPALTGWQKFEASPLEKFADDLEGFGIITGKASGVFVFDIDNLDNWESLKQILPDEDLNAIEQAPTVATGSGGIHFYFKHNEEIKQAQNTIKIYDEKTDEFTESKFDIRANGGQVVAPPSLYNGEKEKKNTYYKWITKPDNLTECPPALKRLIIGKDYIYRDSTGKFEIVEKKKDEKTEAKKKAKSKANEEKSNAKESKAKESKAKEPKEKKSKKSKAKEATEDTDEEDTDEEDDEKEDPKKHIINKITFQDIKKILPKLNYKRFGRFETWRALIWIIRRQQDEESEEQKTAEKLFIHIRKERDAEKIKLLNEFSKECPNYKGIEEIEKIYNTAYNGIREGQKIYTLRTLIYRWLKADNLAFFISFIREKGREDFTDINKFDNKDLYAWGDFRRELMEKIWDDYNTLTNYIRKNSPRVLAKILTGKGSYFQKDGVGRISHINRQAFDGDFNISFIEIKEDKRSGQLKSKETTQTFSKIIKEQGILKEFNYADIFPNEKKEPCPDNVFNLWQGFRAEEVETIDETKFKPFLDLLYNGWANKDERLYRHILAWFAYPLQNPGERTDTALYLYSLQGCGKNTITDFIQKYIYGEALSVSFNSFDEFGEKHETRKMGACSANIDEMASRKEEFLHNFDKLKTFITSPKITINPKGMSVFECRNMLNIIMTTNNADALYITPDDRRYNCIKLSPFYKADKTFWDNLYKNHHDQETANHFYTYLKRLNLDEYPDPRKVFETELRAELVKSSQNNVFNFYDDLILSDWTKLQGYDEKNNGFYPADLYEHYQHFIQINGYKNAMTSHKFGAQLKNKLESKRTKHGIFYIMPDLKKTDEANPAQ